jgi:single-strand DNA-binding protein
MNINEVRIAGRLTRDPELRVTPKGTSICQFGVAINRKIPGRDGGQAREEVTYIDSEAWGKTGEAIAKFLTKGKEIYIAGRLQTDTWEDKTSGQKRSKTKVVCENFQFVGGAKQGDETPARSERPPAQEGADEDVPF